MTRWLPILNTIALIVTVAINYVSSTGIINGVTVGSVSDRYLTLVTPSSYAFLIWGFIYLGLLAFVVHMSGRSAKADSVTSRIGWWFILSCAANSGWILVWIYGKIGLSVAIMAILLVTLIKIISRIRFEMARAPLISVLTVWWPFSLYLGWIAMASVVNFSAWLVSLQWDGFGISNSLWAVIMLVSAGIILHLLVWRNNLPVAAIAGAWAISAVGKANAGSSPSLSYLSYIIAGTVFISVIFNFRKWFRRVFHNRL